MNNDNNEQGESVESSFQPNTTQTPNYLFDVLLSDPNITPLELKIYLIIVRKTFGWHKEWDRISISQFCKITGASDKGVREAIKKLVNRKLILFTGRKTGTKNWRVVIGEIPKKQSIGSRLPEQKSKSIGSRLPEVSEVDYRKYRKRTTDTKDTSTKDTSTKLATAQKVPITEKNAIQELHKWSNRNLTNSTSRIIENLRYEVSKNNITVSFNSWIVSDHIKTIIERFFYENCVQPIKIKFID